MDQKILISAVVAVVALVIVSIIILNPSEDREISPLDGGPVDEHGCIGSAGETWCEAKNKCIFPWVESCGMENSSLNETKVSDIVSANNEFAMDIYKELSTDAGNLFFSPLSLETALSMTYEGARGTTAEEMQSVLHVPADENVRLEGFEELMTYMNSGSDDYKLSIANAVWAQKDFPFLDSFLSIVRDSYQSKVENLDFIGDTEGSRQTINTWVEDETNDRIKDLIPPEVLTLDTRMVLTNAIYFKGDWAIQFKEENTRDSDFTTGDGSVVTAPMMFQSDESFEYGQTDDLQALKLPYKGRELSMFVLLPKGDISELEASLSSAFVSDILSRMYEKELPVYLPKFKLETKYFLTNTLSEMGMPTAFGMAADFSGMDGKEDLYISAVIHQAFVEVNEEGTEAAAATAVVMALKGMGTPTEFRADHPFIFMIMDDTSGAILFAGRVDNPL